MAIKAKLKNICSHAVQRMGRKLEAANLLGRSYGLRAINFHHIADRESIFTEGLRLTTKPDVFENMLRYFVNHYNILDINTIASGSDNVRLPQRPLLVTFDDAYVSAAQIGAPLCRKYGIPAVFFVSASLIDNNTLPLDNLICYIANTMGITVIENVCRKHFALSSGSIQSVCSFLNGVLPDFSYENRTALACALASETGLDTSALAREAGLFISRDQLKYLADNGFHIGNHTYSHVHCRHLDQRACEREIIHNKNVLEVATGTQVRAFSFPYGSHKDATPTVLETLRSSGHEVGFLVESRPNTYTTNPFCYNRISLKAQDNVSAFLEIEILPRLRIIKSWALH